jgi:GR25 family glycosyltransferase involved in LPS biosynthesis
MDKKLNLPFDEVYCINLVEREDRYNLQCKQYQMLGIDNKVIFHRDVKHPFVNEISGFLKTNYGAQIDKSAFNCTRNHYMIIKSAYLRGVNSIMVIEDDNQFYNDIEVLQKYFDNLPNDWEVLRINCLRGKFEQDQFLRQDNIDILWKPIENALWGTGCYALSREGMRKMIEWVDTRYDAIDIPLYQHWKLKAKQYIPNIPLGLCFAEQYGTDIGVGTQLNGPQYYYKQIVGLDESKYTY